MEQIAENVFVETAFFGSNNSMIVTEEGIVLIDSPFRPTDALRWRAEIEARGEALYLVNTDDHIDHTLGNFFFDCRIIAHEETRRKMVETTAPNSNKILMSVLSANDPAGSAAMGKYVRRLPSITVNDRMTLHLGATVVELMHSKGHTRNGLMAYLPRQRILFSGDNVCEGSLPTFKEAYLREWFETLDHIMGMEVDLIVPGHGAVCGKDTARLFRDRMGELVSRVRGEIDRGLPREQVVERVRYEDRIHTGTEASLGYPPEMLEDFQRKSVGRIYDQILATLTAPGQTTGCVLDRQEIERLGRTGIIDTVSWGQVRRPLSGATGGREERSRPGVEQVQDADSGEGKSQPRDGHGATLNDRQGTRDHLEA